MSETKTTTEPQIPHPLPRTLQQKIIDATLLYYSITVEDLKKAEHLEKRKIIAYLLREKACMKIQAIANLFDYKSHGWTATIINEIASIKNIYGHISNDIKNIMLIVDTLV